MIELHNYLFRRQVHERFIINIPDFPKIQKRFYINTVVDENKL